MGRWLAVTLALAISLVSGGCGEVGIFMEPLELTEPWRGWNLPHSEDATVYFSSPASVSLRFAKLRAADLLNPYLAHLERAGWRRDAELIDLPVAGIARFVKDRQRLDLLVRDQAGKGGETLGEVVLLLE
jgi:hypothetical protein